METLNHSNEVCVYVTALLSLLNLGKEEIYQAIAVVLCRLADLRRISKSYEQFE